MRRARRRSADRAEVGDRDAEEVHRLRHVLAVEMAARDRDVAAGAVVEDQRVVGRGVDLGREDALDVFDRLDRRPVHLRRAAQANRRPARAAAPACRAARLSSGKTISRAACEQRFVPSRMRRSIAGDAALAGMRTRLVQARIEGSELAAHRLERQAERDVGLLQEPARVVDGEHAERKRRRRAVDEGRGVLRAERRNRARSPPSRIASRAGMRLPL